MAPNKDQLGSVRDLANITGTVVADYTYDAYGNLTASQVTGTVPNPFGYAGQYTDAESGLIYLRARYYDPATGQFMGRDPLVGITGEPFGYGRDNPLNEVDLLGLYGFGLAGQGGAEIGVGTLGTGLQEGVGIGIFTNGSKGCKSIATFSSQGAFAGTPFSNGPSMVGPGSAIGAYGGLGGGGFITNANSPEQLAGPFETYTLDTPVGSVQFAKHGKIWIVSGSVGPAAGFAVSVFKTTTTFLQKLHL